MRFPLRVVFLLSAIFALAVAAPASAQYMYLDANANGIHDSGDQLNSNGTPTTVDVYIDTDSNKDGSDATCDTADGPLSINSYVVELAAVDGTVSYSGFINRQTTMTTSFLEVNTGNSQYKNGFGQQATLSAGTYKLCTITITGDTGTPAINIVDIIPGTADLTSFGSNCSGNDFDNTQKLVGPSGIGSDWRDTDGLAAAPGGVVNNPPTLSAIGNKTVDEMTALTFTATATDTDTGQTLAFSLDAGAPTGATIDASTGAFSWTPSEAQGPGSFPITVRVTDDGAPTKDDFETITVTVNEVNRPPVVTNPGNKTISELSSLTFTVTGSDPDLPSNTISWSLDAGAPAGATIGASTAAFSWTPNEAQGPGVFPVTIRATDNGTPSMSATAPITITVNEVNVAPVLAPIGNKSATVGAALTFTATATDVDLPANTLTFSLDAGSPAGATINAGTGAFSWTPATGQVGGNGITIRVTDNGTPPLSAFETITVNVVAAANQAPTLAAIGNKTVNELATLAFTATATDPDASQILTFSLDAGAPAGATIGSTGAFSWTPTEAQGPGSFPITVRVTDNGTPALNDFEAITVTVNEVNLAPVVTSPGNKTVDELAALTFTATATDADLPANTFAWSLDAGAPAGATIGAGTGAFSWTPTEAQGPGTFPVTIRATDNGTPALSGTAAITITVNEVNAAPVLAAIGNKSVAELSTLAFTATATDPDVPANTLTFSLDSPSPAGATISPTTGAFSWTPTEAQGPAAIPVTVRVTDNGTPALSAFETIAVAITEVNQAPVVTNPGNKTVDELAALTFTATATDADVPANAIAWSLDAGAPSGAAINASTGAFSWTPSEAQGPGSYPVTIRATDDGNAPLSGTAAITITVNEVNVAPVLTGIGNQAGTVGVPVTFTATATDADVPANTLAFSLDAGAPAGAAINAGTGAFSWTPGANGTFPVTVRVTDNGTPSLSDFEVLSIVVSAAPNQAPVLNAIGNESISENNLLLFTATATDPDAGQTLTFSLDAGAPAGATINGSTGAFSWQTLEADGGNTFPITIRVTDDGAPPLSDAETINVTVTDSNQAPILAAIGNKTVDELATLSFTATAIDEDIPAQTLTFSLDAGAPAGAAITAGGAFSWTPTEAQGPGSYPVTVRVTDNGVGALSRFEAITITVNEVNVAPVLGAIGDKAGTAGVPVTFTATATDTDVPANTLAFSLDSGAPAGATINSSTGAFSFTPSTNGTFPVTVRVTDNGTPSLFDFEAISIVVSAAPNQAPVLGAIGNKTLNEETNLAFTATATDPDAGQTLTFSLDAGSPAGAGIDGPSGAFSWTPTEAQGPGSYPITVRVTDDGTPNLNDSENITVTVNEVNVAPALAPIGNKAGTTGVAITFTATATDGDIPANTLVFSLDAGAPAGATIGASTGAFSWTPGAPGSFPLTVRVTDNGTPALAGFEAITITVNEAAVNHPPALADIGNKTVDELATLAFTATATDPDAGDALSFTLDSGAPAGAAITAGGAFSWTPTEAQGPGSYPATIRVTDNGTPNLDDFEAISITVNEVNVAPVLAAIGNKSGTSGVAIAFTASATDADIPSNTLAFSLDAGAPSGATINPSTGAFSWTPTAGGTFGATVRVTDNGVPALDDFEAITFTVTEQVVNHPPVLAAIGNKTVNELTALAFTATATDPDAGQTLVFSLDAGAPAGATINASSGAFGWTPTEAQGPGNYPITVRVTDNGSPTMNDFEAITVTVSEVNVAPVLAAIPDKTGTVGVAVTFTATATDADIPANSLAFSLASGAPSGATINAATGAFSWTPTAAGTFPVTVRVTDDGTPALSDSKSLTIAVTASQQVVAANAFFFGLNLLTILESRDPYTCVQIEPVRKSFDIKKVDLNSITMTYKGMSITANAQLDGDRNRDGDHEIQACFSKPDLRRLFASLPRGLHLVKVDIAGNLPNGVRFKDQVDHFVLVLGIDCLAIQLSPNPLNPETVLTFVTSKSGPVSIQIFDVQGRLVKSLYNGTMDAGLNQVRWDGSSRNGNRVATGVYFIRTRTVDGEAVERATVLK